MELLFLTGKRTVLYPQIKRMVELLDKDIFDRIQKWRMFSAIGKLQLLDFYGNQISYEGIRYGGSPERVFWFYFPPFFEHEIPKILNEINNICEKKNLTPDEYLQEGADLLKVMVSRLWKEIAKTDQCLKGNGYPKKEDLKDVTGKINMSNLAIEAELKAILHCDIIKPVVSEKVNEDIIDLKPNFMGIGLNLNAIYRWVSNKYKNM